MATKKQPVAKKGKAPVKPAAKKVAKPVAKKASKPAPAKKTAPKKAAKPAPKPVKKPVAKLPPKKVAKPVAKPAPAKKAPVKAAVKVAPKPAPVVKKEEPKKSNSIKTSADIKAKDIKVPAAKPVAIPKLTTTAARKYEPSFTKSVLDKAPVEANTPTMRYSDTELNEFRELIQRKLEAAKKELTYLQGLITRKDDMGGDEGDNRYMTMEDGSLSMEREQLSQMASRQITFIDHLEKALMRIENKTYGICRVTGKLIDKARLRAVPHATLSIEAKMGKVI
jgi:RNA polymerase-binding transcription factor DksA